MGLGSTHKQNAPLRHLQRHREAAFASPDPSPLPPRCIWGFCSNKPPNKPKYLQQATERKAPSQIPRVVSQGGSISGAVPVPSPPEIF